MTRVPRSERQPAVATVYPGPREGHSTIKVRREGDRAVLAFRHGVEATEIEEKVALADLRALLRDSGYKIRRVERGEPLTDGMRFELRWRAEDDGVHVVELLDGEQAPEGVIAAGDFDAWIADYRDLWAADGVTVTEVPDA